MIDNSNMIKIKVLLSTVSGCNILKMELFNNSNPISNIASEIKSPAIYSNLPCPNGCSKSGFFPENRNPIKEIKEEKASDKLLKASAVIATEPLSTPAMYLNKNKRIFKQIPTIQHNVPYPLRCFVSSTFFKKKRANNVIKNNSLPIH